MREIKFRAKERSGEWVVGGLFVEDGMGISYIVSGVNTHYETNYSTVEVVSETVGQFTGLKDSTGKEIYEGDIVAAALKDKSFVKRFHMDETVAGIISFDGAWWLGEWDALWRLPRYYDLTVIGNIHDNPELLRLTKNGGLKK